MAQTVAIQRGTVSFASGSGSNTTLFTQSGGNATRVILNMLAWYSTDGQMNAPQFNLIHTGSNGVPCIIGYAKYTGGSIWGQQLNPAGNGFGFAQWGGNTGTAPVSSQLVSNNGARFPAQETANYASVSAPASNNQAYAPLNFWIGPSDSVQVSLQDSNSRTISLGYSFTTITES